jgi:hypothetical protein
MNWLIKIGFFAWIKLNSKIFFKVVFSSLLIFVCNLVYSKYESLLLISNPEKLFIPLYIYTFLIISLVLWCMASFRFFSSIRDAKQKLIIKSSFLNKSDAYKKIADVRAYPQLKSKTDKILNKQ